MNCRLLITFTLVSLLAAAVVAYLGPLLTGLLVGFAVCRHLRRHLADGPG